MTPSAARRSMRNTAVPGLCDAVRGEPGHDVGDFLVRHRLAGHVSAPVGRAQFRTARDDDRAQP